jgi:hypothetical protein
LAAIQKPINAEGLAISGQHVLTADPVAPVTASSARRLISIWRRNTHRHWSVFAHVRINAGERPSSAPTSMSNEPRRHFRVLLDRTESP